jgi:hypothetical protein
MKVMHKRLTPADRSLTEVVTAVHGQNRDATCKLPLGDKKKFLEVCYAVAMAQLERTLAGTSKLYMGAKIRLARSQDIGGCAQFGWVDWAILWPDKIGGPAYAYGRFV